MRCVSGIFDLLGAAQAGLSLSIASRIFPSEIKNKADRGYLVFLFFLQYIIHCHGSPI